MKEYKHLFFDLDRTIWDLETNSKELLQEIFQKYELEILGIPEFQQFYEAYLPINKELWRKYRHAIITKEILSLERFNLTLATFNINNQELAYKISRYYIEQSPYKTHLFEGAHELLDNLSKRYSLHIITNGFAEVQILKLKQADLDKYFQEIIISEQTPWKKPSKKLFKYALNQADAKASESMMIGDDIRADIIGAAGVGIDQIWTNFNNSESFTKPTYVVTKLTDILKIL